MFDSVWLFAMNKTLGHNGSTKITVCLKTDCLSLAKGAMKKVSSAQHEIKNLEVYVTVGREKKRQINTFIMFS